MFFRSRPAASRSTRSRSLRVEPLEPRHLLNAAPTELLLPLSTVLEHQPAGTPVGMFASSDPDQFETFTYTLVSGSGSDDNASFTIDAMGDLLTASSFDYFTKSSYSIRVRTTDQAGLWLEQSFTVAVEPLTSQRVDPWNSA